MKSQVVLNLIKDINSDIAKYIQELSNFKDVNSQYIPEFRKERYDKMRDEFMSKISLKFKKLLDTIAEFRRSLVLERDKSKRAFNANSDSEILVYYQEKSDFIIELQRLNADKILEMYKEYVRLGEGFERKVQMFEDSAFNILHNKDRSYANKFTVERERNIESRLGDDFKEKENYLKVFGSFERTASNFLDESKMFSSIPDNILYVFHGLSRNLELEVSRLEVSSFKMLNYVL